MTDKLFELLLAAIPVIGTIITVFIVPYLKSKLGTEKLNNYMEYAKLGVKAAEIIYNETGMGIAKKEYAVKFMNEFFNKNKTVITEKQIEVLIEAAVQELKLVQKNS